MNATVIVVDPRLAAAIDWLLSNPPIGRRVSVLRRRFGLSTAEILQAWRLARLAEPREPA